jgi:hypothetical protein
MPRPYPPPPLPMPTVEPFELNSMDQRRIARTVGAATLSSDAAAVIAHAIACFKATQRGSPDTTRGNTLAALAELSGGGRAFDAAVPRFATDQSGVDYTTLERLQPLARSALAGDRSARQSLEDAARTRAAELRSHPRVAPETESLRFFCGMLRVIFDATASSTIDRTWRNCGAFALEACSVAGIDHADFDAHPERLKEYLGTDVSTG